MTAEEVATKTLVLQVFDWDLITGDDDIGEVLILSPTHILHSTFIFITLCLLGPNTVGKR